MGAWDNGIIICDYILHIIRTPCRLVFKVSIKGMIIAMYINWGILGIDPTTNSKEIKRAYAKQTKVYHPEENPEMFAKLLEAYKNALEYAKSSESESPIEKTTYFHNRKEATKSEYEIKNINASQETTTYKHNEDYDKVFTQLSVQHEKENNQNISRSVKKLKKVILFCKLFFCKKPLQWLLNSKEFIAIKEHSLFITEITDYLSKQKKVSLWVHAYLYDAFADLFINNLSNPQVQSLFSLLRPKYEQYCENLPMHKYKVIRHQSLALLIFCCLGLLGLFFIIPFIFLVMFNLIIIVVIFYIVKFVRGKENPYRCRKSFLINACVLASVYLIVLVFLIASI